MVRGYTRCSRFCKFCKQDCRCSACDRCHTCRLRSFEASGENLRDRSSKEKSSDCKTYQHDCLDDAPKMDKTIPEEGKSCWDSFVRLRGTSPGNQVNFEKFSQSGIVTIHLTKENIKYNIHESLLLAESLYFQRMLEIKMLESQTREVSLGLEVDTKIAFDRFIQWCYFGYYIYDNDKNLPLLSIDAAVYVFASRVMCDDLQDFAVKQAKALCNSKDKSTIQANLSILPETIEFVYENTYSADTEEGVLMQSVLEELDLQMDFVIVSHDEPQTIGAVGSRVPQDNFRKLLAFVSARHLDQLRKEPSFMTVHRSLSDFAADVLFFVQQSSDEHEPVKHAPCILS
ncbi:hypothetical protein AOL_s00043g357 [Orbilia oligospora ATCC 24927]|uniref:BTB domain-containing protein n=1 Tax=Arthrobotrys oligospora (strain ATCC 24927 / CBS 115.81 / DSM 1491) TaxID=756982 RepID=G1X3T3_ARTOA|nr:hypothetical protein AOL_s00043g357 [Orbilia oligospora ATCC 24927]EGX52214.1 hypothetical protein AOL_s00043g357 [Orbilia oligospora ATCC 24927]